MMKVLVVMGQACCTATSCPMKWRRRSRYWLYNSMSLCPAPSTQRGSTALGQRSNRARPWEKSITSSSVPWMMSTGDVILDTFSMLDREKGMRRSNFKELVYLVRHPYKISESRFSRSGQWWCSWTGFVGPAIKKKHHVVLVLRIS